MKLAALILVIFSNSYALASQQEYKKWDEDNSIFLEAHYNLLAEDSEKTEEHIKLEKALRKAEDESSDKDNSYIAYEKWLLEKEEKEETEAKQEPDYFEENDTLEENSYDNCENNYFDPREELNRATISHREYLKRMKIQRELKGSKEEVRLQQKKLIQAILSTHNATFKHDKIKKIINSSSFHTLKESIKIQIEKSFTEASNELIKAQDYENQIKTSLAAANKQINAIKQKARKLEERIEKEIKTAETQEHIAAMNADNAQFFQDSLQRKTQQTVWRKIKKDREKRAFNRGFRRYKIRKGLYQKLDLERLLKYEKKRKEKKRKEKKKKREERKKEKEEISISAQPYHLENI